ncbi:hypothetical protein FZ934_20195 (plasmid) [Rhizobium grahamii]|uniref:Uncharacterized protein n=1 Tax=Rhizobium grahamii TaxID=1120045 RepID=A0A5Q0CB92_9HYPH|nr:MULTISPECIES: DNA cytosine methyltransferase [Rhizobium]QFY62703.1 hypothetical protein FZ934_20195 [Rhizobium grahamii]QRM52553.1 hypothetical protein F3Y33_25465 [Rhizobium sp. BG6]
MSTAVDSMQPENKSNRLVVRDESADALSVARKKLLAFRRSQARAFFDAAATVAELEKELGGLTSQVNLFRWLQRDVGFSAAEARSCIDFNHQFAGAAAEEVGDALVEGCVSQEAIRAFVKCDWQSKSETLIRLRRGDRVHAVAVERIRRENLTRALPHETIVQRERRAYFGQAARKLGMKTKASLEREANDILELLKQRDALAKDSGTDSIEAAKQCDVTSAIQKKARKTLTSLKTLFGKSTPPRPSVRGFFEGGAAEAALAGSWHELERLRDGKLDELSLVPGSGVAYLAGKISSAVVHLGVRSPVPVVPENMKFVDIDAGVGGMALGLRAAGFLPAAVFTAGGRQKIDLKKNMPLWDIEDRFTVDVKGVYSRLATQDIDVLTSGRPWHSYTNRREYLNNALDAVSTINPKVFVFEGRPEDSKDQPLAASFEELGYDVNWHSIDLGQFGIAQSKPRELIVGTRWGLDVDIKMPIIEPPLPSGLGRSLARLMSEHARNSSEDPVDRKKFRKAVGKWLGKRWNAPIPEFPLPKHNVKKSGWAALGIDISGFKQRPPTPEEFKKPFKLSVSMLKVLQGFPDVWEAEREHSFRSHPVAVSFPPSAARMVGMAIHAAMKEVDFDYRRACEHRLVHEVTARDITGLPIRLLETIPVSEFVGDRSRVFRISAEEVEKRRQQDLDHWPELKEVDDPEYRQSFTLV